MPRHRKSAARIPVTNFMYSHPAPNSRPHRRPPVACCESGFLSRHLVRSEVISLGVLRGRCSAAVPVLQIGAGEGNRGRTHAPPLAVARTLLFAEQFRHLADGEHDTYRGTLSALWAVALTVQLTRSCLWPM